METLVFETPAENEIEIVARIAAAAAVAQGLQGFDSL